MNPKEAQQEKVCPVCGGTLMKLSGHEFCETFGCKWARELPNFELLEGKEKFSLEDIQQKIEHQDKLNNLDMTKDAKWMMAQLFIQSLTPSSPKQEEREEIERWAKNGAFDDKQKPATQEANGMDGADEILKEMGFYFIMPRPYTHENVKEAMGKYVSKELAKKDEEIEELGAQLDLCAELKQQAESKLESKDKEAVEFAEWVEKRAYKSKGDWYLHESMSGKIYSIQQILVLYKQSKGK